jgi:hypothetical protein
LSTVIKWVGVGLTACTSGLEYMSIRLMERQWV